MKIVKIEHSMYEIECEELDISAKWDTYTGYIDGRLEGKSFHWGDGELCVFFFDRETGKEDSRKAELYIRALAKIEMLQRRLEQCEQLGK